MIGLILGTSEGKKILSMLNDFTEDIFITTATTYGGELLKDYKYKELNTKPLNKEELKEKIIKNKINILVDASHPYASEITSNAIEVCKQLKIKYIRYERPSVVKKYTQYEKLVWAKNYDELGEKLKNINGVILNTTGSRNVEKFKEFKLKNRIIHRVLPTVESIKKCIESGIAVEDILAVKGPVGKELNRAFIDEYSAKAIVMKDSGVQGGTEEKIEAAMESDIWIFVIERSSKNYEICFNDERNLVEYLKKICKGLKN